MDLMPYLQLLIHNPKQHLEVAQHEPGNKASSSMHDLYVGYTCVIVKINL